MTTTPSTAVPSLATSRRIVLWPWDLTPSPGGHGLAVVAVANPAIEAVLVREGASVVAKSPQEVYPADRVDGYRLILRVIEAPTEAHARAGHAASPRLDVATQRVVVEHFDAATSDLSDPRLVRPKHGLGVRLPSISHLRRVELDAKGALRQVLGVVLPDATRFETLGKEDPSVTWLDGVPHLSYVGVSEYGITPVLARGTVGADGAIAYARVAEAMGHHDNRDVKILPRRIRGRMWRHDRPNTLPWAPKRTYACWSPDDGVSWSASLPLYEGRGDWERNHVGGGAVPFVHRAADGRELLVAFYHGVAKREGAVAGVYQTGVIAFDAEDPMREVGRFDRPVLEAWADAAFDEVLARVNPLDGAAFQHRHGLFVVRPVVFTTGHTRVGETQVVFSGVNDFCIEVAELPSLDRLLADPAFRTV